MNLINSKQTPPIENFDKCCSNLGNKDARTVLIEAMMRNEIMLDWNGMNVTNPYFVAHMVGTHGLPIETLRDMIEEKNGEKGVRWEWTEWCEHWFNSFLKIPIKTLLG